MRSNWWLILLVAAAACGSEEAAIRPNPANRSSGYFSVKGFLDTQMVNLNRRQPAVEKQVRLRDGKLETTRVTKTDWSKELQIFYQADISKPALRGTYEIAKAPPSAGAGTVYKRKSAVDTPVDELFVGGAISQPEMIAATIVQNNPLFYSQKKLRLQVNPQGLRSYSVEGIQKLVLFDTVRYSVRTRVLD